MRAEVAAASAGVGAAAPLPPSADEVIAAFAEIAKEGLAAFGKLGADGIAILGELLRDVPAEKRFLAAAILGGLKGPASIPSARRRSRR